MQEIELTQGQVALVDDVDYEYLSQWKWYAGWYRNCFRARRTTYNGKKKAVHMSIVVAERMGIDAKCIDHKDRNPLNNQRSNLRPATDAQNGHNCEAYSTSKTGVKGVWFDEARGKFQTAIWFEGKRYALGRFYTLPEAAAVVQKKREELVGEFACH
jgi:hypothetical protein